MCFQELVRKQRNFFVQDRNKVDLCLASQANPCFPMFRGDDVGGTCFASWMTQWCFQTAWGQSWCWSWVDSIDKRSSLWRPVQTLRTLKVLARCWSRTTVALTCEKGHDPGQDVIILNSLANQQARVMAKANLLRRDRIPKQLMQPTPMMGRNMQNLGMKLRINPGRMIHMLVCLVTLQKRSQET